MAMELFDKKGGKLGNPSVSITTAGQIGLSSACVEKYFKGRHYVLLYGDKEAKTIGIKPIEKHQDNAFKISYSENANSGSLSGHSFLNYLGINYKSKTNRYTPEWNDKQKMLIFKIT